MLTRHKSLILPSLALVLAAAGFILLPAIERYAIHEEQIETARSYGVSVKDPAYLLAWHLERECQGHFSASKTTCVSNSVNVIEHSALSKDQKQKAQHFVGKLAGISDL